MKKLIAVAASAVLLVGLAGCASTGSLDEPITQENRLSFSEDWIQLSDGRLVFCITVGYGMSCDWENAK